MVQLSDRRPDHKEVTREAPQSFYRMDTPLRFVAAECRPGRDMARRDRIRHRGDIRHRHLCCVGLQTADRTFSAVTPTGAGDVPHSTLSALARVEIMNVCARVDSHTAQRMQRRGLRQERAKELLLADAIVGFNDIKSGRAINETEFRRRFRQ